MWKDLGKFLALVCDQVGKRYIWGYEVKLNDPDPKAFDCSELVQWAYAQVGLMVPDGSAAQWNFVVRHQTEIPVEVAMWKGGALLFRRNKKGQICHVGISIGDGTVVEARGKCFGVARRQVRIKDWDCAGKVHRDA